MRFERVDRGLDLSDFKQEDVVEQSRFLSNILREVRKNVKSETCYCCGKKTTSFCDSHTIPKYCLENISNDGMVLSPNAIIGFPSLGVSIGKTRPGIGESGTFNLICNECDKTMFRDYENPNNYYLGKIPDKRMLAQIAMKDYLKFVSKRKREIAIIEKYLSIPADNLMQRLLQRDYVSKLGVFRIDLAAYNKEFENAKEYLNYGRGRGYHLLFYRLLDYVAPIAIQAPIAVAIDYDGYVINDLLNRNKEIEIFDLHVCVLPQKETTAVMLFVKEGCTVYRRFRRQLLALDAIAQLGVINYIIFLYSEDYFLSQEVQSKISLDELNEVANITPVIRTKKNITDTKVMKEQFILSKWSRIPNLLDSKYKIR